VEIEDKSAGRKVRRGVNQILDDALGAFIDVLDQHTLADMAAGQTPDPVPLRRKAPTRSAAVTGSRFRRALHDGG
jgi:hypothetical protein